MTPHAPVEGLVAKWLEKGRAANAKADEYLAETGTADFANLARAITYAAVANELQRALASLPVEGWRSMDSAPKDGTPILGQWVNTNPNITQNGRVDFDCMYIVWWDGYDWETTGYDHMYEMEPTRWQPLPQPPQDQRQGNEQGGTHE